MADVTTFILASRSPRRRELLGLVVPPERIVVCPPRSAVEPGFDDVADWPGLLRRLAEIARMKGEDVATQRRALAASSIPNPVPAHEIIIAADTVVAVEPDGECPRVLGQPPDDERYATTVRHWFRDHYAGKTHAALTAVCVGRGDGTWRERVVRTDVSFRRDVDPWLDWYIATGEPRGKAGGYALQGAGSLFITHTCGSLSNVIGLPLEAVRELLGSL